MKDTNSLKYWQIKLSIVISVSVLWSLYVLFFVVTPDIFAKNHSKNMIFVDDLLRDNELFGTHTWLEGTQFRWYKHQISVTFTQPHVHNVFVTFTGMAYKDMPYRFDLTDAVTQRLTIKGEASGFRTYRMVFLTTDKAWGSKYNLLTVTPEVTPSVVNDSSLSLAISRLKLHMDTTYVGIFLQTFILVIFLIGVISITDIQQSPVVSILSPFILLGTAIWADYAVWNQVWILSLWILVLVLSSRWIQRWILKIAQHVLQVVVTSIDAYPEIRRQFIASTLVCIDVTKKLIKTPRGIIGVIVVIIIPFLWICMSSYYIIYQWGWDLDQVFPMPLIIAGMISWPLLSFMVYKIILIPRYHKVTVIFVGLYVCLGVMLFSQSAPGCLNEDAQLNFVSVHNGHWHGFYSLIHFPLLTGLVQIIPWGYNAPFIFHILAWAMTMGYAHSILYRQRSHWIFHVLLICVVVTPTFLIAVMYTFHHTIFTVLFLYLLLLFYATITFGKVNRYSHLIGISILSTILMIYRSDAIPVGIMVFAIVMIMILKPEYVIRIGTVLGRSKLHENPFKLVLVICLVVPFFLIMVYARIIPYALNSNNEAYKGNSWNDWAKNYYSLVLVENSLGYILKHPSAVIRPEYRQQIEKAYDLEKLKEVYCPHVMCYWLQVFYHGDIIPTAEMNANAVRGTIGLILDNPALFFESRIAYVNSIGGYRGFLRCDYTYAFMKQKIDGLYGDTVLTPFGRIIVSYFLDLVQKVRVDTDIWGKGILFNVFVYFSVLLIIIFSYFKTPVISLVALMLLIRSVIVILTAPATFLTYHLPLYVGVLIIAILWLSNITKRKNKGLNIS